MPLNTLGVDGHILTVNKVVGVIHLVVSKPSSGRQEYAAQQLLIFIEYYYLFIIYIFWSFSRAQKGLKFELQ